MFTLRFPQPATGAADHLAQEAYLAGNYFVTWCSWIGLSVLGIVLANFIPAAWGLGFAGVLCLVGILCSLANTPMRMLSGALAGATAVALYSLPLKLNIVAAILVAVAACSVLERKLPQGGPQ
jgi:predicted branched-subunit amino acid permease